MTFTDAVRQLMHDPIRLGALRSPSGLAPIMPTTGRGFLSLLTDGRLVWKTEHGQRMEGYVATVHDVLAEDWVVSNMVPVQNPPTADLAFSRPPTPPPSTLGVERYAKGDFRTTPGASPPVGGQGPAGSK